MSLDEYYERLGLPSAATPAEVKRAYRRLRAKYHPDRNKGAEATVEPAFKRVQEAFEILTGQRAIPHARASTDSRPHTRQADTHARSAPSEEARRSAGGASAPWSSHIPKSGPMPVRGANRHTQLHVPLDVALNGGEVLASYTTSEPCRQCRGFSARYAAALCESCGGRGTALDGQPCGTCAGQGRAKNGQWCPRCQNKGVEYPMKTEPVVVPGGAWDGQRIVVAGGGFPGVHGGASGDATFTVVIVCGAHFQREGLHLSGEIEVDFVTATLGGPFDAKVLGRDLRIEIPPNAQHGSLIRLPRHGLSDATGNRGEMRLRLVLAMPKAAAHLTGDQRQVLKEMFVDAARRANEA